LARAAEQPEATVVEIEVTPCKRAILSQRAVPSFDQHDVISTNFLQAEEQERACRRDGSSCANAPAISGMRDMGPMRPVRGLNPPAFGRRGCG
jgi:hypothetical protein